MSAVPSTIDRTHPKARSRVSNGKTALLFADGRSVGARRYRDLIAEFANDLGGFNSLSAQAQQMARRLAQISVELERLESASAQGIGIEPVAYCRLVNAQRRLMRDLAQTAPKPKTASTDLTAHLAANYGRGEAA